MFGWQGPNNLGRCLLRWIQCQAADLRRRATRHQQDVMLSLGGLGTGGMWSMRGVGERGALQNGDFRECFRIWMGAASALCVAKCQLHRQRGN